VRCRTARRAFRTPGVDPGQFNVRRKKRMDQDRPQSRKPGRVMIVIAALIGFVVVSIFVGYNIFHAKTMQQEKGRSLG
jgi:hypothetical protein